MDVCMNVFNAIERVLGFKAIDSSTNVKGSETKLVGDLVELLVELLLVNGGFKRRPALDSRNGGNESRSGCSQGSENEVNLHDEGQLM
jgi:hypothetical protein